MSGRIFLLLFILLITSQARALAVTSDDKRLEFTVPAAPWTLTLPANNFEVKQREIKPDGQYGYFLMGDTRAKMVVSMFIEPVENCKDSKACRDMVWKIGNPAWENPQNVVLSEIGDISFFEFLIPSFKGMAVQQQNMFAEFVVDGFWVDLHISKILYKPQEHELFEQLVKSVKFEPKKAGAKSRASERDKR